MEWLKVTGTLIYDPVRRDANVIAKLEKRGESTDGKHAGFRKTNKTRTLILDLPRDDLAEYYRWWLRRKYGEGFKMQAPMWGTHVTVVRGNEHVPDLSAWKKHDRAKVTVEYAPGGLSPHWRFWTLPVRSSKLDDLRAELGLKNFHRHHITIGRTDDWVRHPKELA